MLRVPCRAHPSLTMPNREKVLSLFRSCSGTLALPGLAGPCLARPKEIYGNSLAALREKKDSFAMASVFSFRSESLSSSALT